MKKKLNKWVLGLIVLPFAVVIVWILLGVFFHEDIVPYHSDGFNTQLPAANLSKDSALGKLSFYTAAKQDSIRYAEMLQMDPYRTKNESFGNDRFEFPGPSFYEPPKRPVGIESLPATISFEQNKIKSGWEEKDTTLDAIQHLLDQLASFQQIKDSAIGIRETKSSVTSKEEEDYFGITHPMSKSSFYGLQNVSPLSRRWMASLPTQVLQNGSVVKLQLLEDLLLPDGTLKAGSTIYGMASLQAERLQVHITSIPCVDRIVQVNLQVYDVDGMKGINVPGSPSKEVFRAAVDPAIGSMEVPLEYGSIVNKVALTGMQTAKQLMAKKAKATRIHVSSGYRVYLYHQE